MSCSWTVTKAGYGQVQWESNGIQTGMHMNKIYVVGTHTELVTDHKPLLPLYNSPSKPKQPCVDRHQTKLLAFDYRVSHKKGIDKKLLFGAVQGLSLQFLNLIGFSISVSFVWCII